MKYCSKCGNPMEDDMVYCPKCGTEYVEILSVDTQVQKIKSYNLVLKADSISWQFSSEHPEDTYNLMAKQVTMAQECFKLIEDVLSDLPEDNSEKIIDEVYMYALDTGVKACNEAAKLYANYNGIQKELDNGMVVFNAGKISAENLILMLKNADLPYLNVAATQSYIARELKKKLNEDIIYSNAKFRESTFKLAQAYNDAQNALARRRVHFYLSALPEGITQDWDYYQEILKGLPQQMIDDLDEQGWDYALEDMAKHNEAPFVKTFNETRNKIRTERLQSDEKKFQELFPDRYVVVQELKETIKEKEENAIECKKKNTELEREYHRLLSERKGIERTLSSKEYSLAQLEKKIFGKKKNQESIAALKIEIEDLNKKISLKDEEINNFSKPSHDYKMELGTINNEIKELNVELKDLMKLPS